MSTAVLTPPGTQDGAAAAEQARQADPAAAPAPLTSAAPVRDVAPADSISPETAAEDSPASRVWQQVGPSLGYVGYFVGAGLISGGIVQYTLDPTRYLKVAVAGVVVFLVATVLNEIVLPKARPARGPLLRIVGGSLLLSLGIGMFSGGIQHFSDFPARSATLVPAGLALSFLAFHVRNAVHVRRAVVGRVGAGVLVLVLAGTSACTPWPAAWSRRGRQATRTALPPLRPPPRRSPPPRPVGPTPQPTRTLPGHTRRSRRLQAAPPTCWRTWPTSKRD